LTPGHRGPTVHPLFPVCFEWPVFLDSRHLPTDLTPGDLFRGVHATHDLTLHRPIHPGMQVTTTATIAAVETRRSGAHQLVRLDTANDEGAPVATTWFGLIYRGLEVVGGDRSVKGGGPVLAPVSADDEFTDIPIPVAADASVNYAEAARIWNPIHTDAAVAEAVGLPGVILQGTATLAMAVSRMVEQRFDGDTNRVERVAGRFGAMVLMPSTLTLRVGPMVDGILRFEMLTADGARAIRDGLITMRSPDSGSMAASA
ncbi:MAG: MaoC/PaaZ C-terminal domain-containing protein, partial [Actinomycetota bacterium]|nr:MaoC/PaaZ C-terminal domain-containing protein [Actinomycetota bacterium]